jgi:hypothetical protein|tara:strand:+ start:312 stop:428 length:117 start_codon:yes stop_codon:yes gene_type:complete
MNDRFFYMLLQIIAGVGVMFVIPAMVALYAIAFGVGGY